MTRIFGVNPRLRFSAAMLFIRRASAENEGQSVQMNFLQEKREFRAYC